MPRKNFRFRREQTEVSVCLKYILFFANVLFWFFGLCVLAIGCWALNEKDKIFSSSLQKVTHLALDPAFILIIVGTVTFIIGFTGCVGSLRENTCLLQMYVLFLTALLIIQISLGVLVFILKDKGWIKDQATEGLRAFIVHYREDPDQQNLIDWIQEDWLQCCGIDGPKDWDNNNYFNCSSRAVGSREACGVPFSCCKRRPTEVNGIINKQCGYDVRKEGFPSDRLIYERGCLRAGEDWVESNLFAVSSVCVGIIITKSLDIAEIINTKGCLLAGEDWIERNLILITTTFIVASFLQILGICFAQNLRADILAQKSKWHHH